MFSDDYITLEALQRVSHAVWQLMKTKKHDSRLKWGKEYQEAVTEAAPLLVSHIAKIEAFEQSN